VGEQVKALEYKAELASLFGRLFFRSRLPFAGACV